MIPTNLPHLVALVGPTASGKSSAALAVARRLRAQGRDAELISVDSALVYRGMDIGTAKPTQAEQAEVRHHLIDLLDPRQAYSAAQFAQDAVRLAAEIRARGHEPLLVGGTMLYVKALCEGLDPLPAADMSIRAELDERAARHGWPALHAQLMQVDPVTAQRLAPNDAQRLQRAWEVYLMSGRPLSAFHGQGGGTPLAQLHLVSLEPQDRAWLHGRIAQRYAQMWQDGLLAEVRQLRERGDLHLGLPSMRCVGYRQTWEALDAAAQEGRSQLEEREVQACLERGIAATRQLAKRQLTWLRSMPERQILPCDAPDALDQACAAVMAAL